ncbi:MAG: hypothetical protein HYU57_07220 [Micavibrio aeruginosavorus]|nr:hypothetical protein [Micavibrio aeruginosavorus]
MAIKNPQGPDAFPNDFRDPDCRQFSFAVFEQLGIEPSDRGEMYLQMVKNSGIMAGGFSKAAWTMEDKGRDHEWQLWQDKQKSDNEHHEQQQQAQKDFQERERDQLQRRLEQERIEREMLEKKQAEEAAAAKNRPNEDAQNNRIMAMPFQMMGAMAFLGFGSAALEKGADAMSPGVSGLGDQMMVTSNNNGGMLDAARQSLSITNPPAQDILVTGPSQTTAFTPGATPDADMDASGTSPQLTQQRNPMFAAAPGIGGPGRKA